MSEPAKISENYRAILKEARKQEKVARCARYREMLQQVDKMASNLIIAKPDAVAIYFTVCELGALSLCTPDYYLLNSWQEMNESLIGVGYFLGNGWQRLADEQPSHRRSSNAWLLRVAEFLEQGYFSLLNEAELDAIIDEQHAHNDAWETKLRNT